MIFQFLNFKLDYQNFILCEYETVLNIEPQVFNVIHYLIQNRDKVISRDELLDNLWSDKEVLDATISNHIKLARSILGDDGHKQAIIKTIRGRGHQFIVPVEHYKGAAKKEKLVQPKVKIFFEINSVFLYLFLLLACSYAIYFFSSQSNKNINDELNLAQEESVLSNQSIAILPFQNRSNIENDQFFTDGFHDDLLTQVSKIEGLKTISRTSVMQYRDTTKNLRVIAKELGVTTILEGGVQRSGDKIRINIQLIDAVTDQHIWASTFTRNLNAKNIFIIQSEISTKIASALKLALIVSSDKLPTQNMKALELYFKAKSILVEKTSYSNKVAIRYLKQTLLKDPRFSLALAELASRYLDQVKLDGIDRKKQVALALPLVKKSLSLAPNESLVHKVDGKLKMYQGNGTSAKISFEKAIDLNHNNSEAIASYAIFQMYAGNLNEAIKLLSRANELSPKDVELQAELALMLMRDSRFAEADILLDKIIKEIPTFAKAYKIKSDIAFYSKHDFHGAISYLIKSISINKGYIEGRKLIADRYNDLGMTGEAIFWLNQFIDQIPDTRESELAKAKIFELQEEYNKAFEIYRNQIYHPHHLLYDFLNVAKITGRTTEAIDHCKKISPAFFTSDLEIETRRMTSAFMLGSILVSNKDPLTDQHRHGLLLLERSLKISQRNINSSRQSKHFDWETRILLALDKKELALESFKEWMNLGFYSTLPLKHSDYESLRDNKEFQDLIKIIKTKILKTKTLKTKFLKENDLTSKYFHTFKINDL